MVLQLNQESRKDFPGLNVYGRFAGSNGGGNGKGGGGGGSGGAGENTVDGSNGRAGNGGSGVNNSITGSPVNYGAGGGGGASGKWCNNLVVHGGAAAVAQVAFGVLGGPTLVTLEHSKTDNLVPPIEVVAVVQLVTAFTHIMEHLQIPVDQGL